MPGEIGTLNPLARHVGYALRRAQLLVFQDFLEATQEFALTPAEYSALMALRHDPGLRLNRLTELLTVKPANCVALVNRLESRGLVLRQKLPVSGRAVALALTPAGLDLLDRMDAAVERHLVRMEARLGLDGMQTLLRLLERLADGNGG